MHHEISQLDIPDRQLLSNVRPSIWTEIGEAQITHTIFGRAKVRIIRKNDHRHRVLWITGIVAIALAAAAWQGLFTSRQAEQSLGTGQSPVEVRENSPAIHSEKSTIPVTPPEATKELSVPIQAELSKPPVAVKSVPQQAHLPMSTESKLVHPGTPRPKPNSVQPEPNFAQPRSVTSEPPSAIRPLVAPRSASSAIKSPTIAQPANSSVPKPTGAVAPALSPTKPVAQLAASSPASVIQLSDPVQKPAAAAAPDNQPPALDNSQAK